MSWQKLSVSEPFTIEMPSVLPAGSIVIYDSTLLHLGWHHNGTAVRHMAYFTLMGEKGEYNSAVKFAMPLELAGKLTLDAFTLSESPPEGTGKMPVTTKDEM